MHPRFLNAISDLDGKLRTLLACAPLAFGQLRVGMPERGVYLFSESGLHLYVGRSNRLRNRYFLHCRPGSRQNQASFAYKLAREALRITRASYASDGATRSKLAETEPFLASFAEAKTRIRTMEYRFVPEEDQVRQALLEAYCAIVLETPYNDFATH